MYFLNCVINNIFVCQDVCKYICFSVCLCFFSLRIFAVSVHFYLSLSLPLHVTIILPLFSLSLSLSLSPFFLSYITLFFFRCFYLLHIILISLSLSLFTPLSPFTLSILTLSSPFYSFFSLSQSLSPSVFLVSFFF